MNNSSDQKNDNLINPLEQSAAKPSDTRKEIINNLQKIQAAIAARPHKKQTPQHPIQ